MGKNEPHTALSPQQVDRPKMACGSAQHEQVPKEMHVFTAIIQKEKDGAKRIAKPAAHQPIERLHAPGGLESHQKRLDSYNHGPAHHKITNGLQVIDLPHPTERQQDTGHGGQPNKQEKPPAPETPLTQDQQRERRIGPGDVQVNSGMIPFPENTFPARLQTGMIKGRDNV